jgi:hypothetical protein
VARGHPSAGYATARIGNRRLGGYEVLRGRQGNSDYLLLRAATEEAAAALPPTPELAAAGTRRCATFADLTESDVSMSGDEADGESDGDDNGDGDEADGDGDEADGDGDGSSSEPESADWVSGAGDASPVQPLQEGASEQAFLLSIIAALQARAPPARLRSLTAAAAASPPAGAPSFSNPSPTASHAAHASHRAAGLPRLLGARRHDGGGAARAARRRSRERPAARDAGGAGGRRPARLRLPPQRCRRAGRHRRQRLPADRR